MSLVSTRTTVWRVLVFRVEFARAHCGVVKRFWGHTIGGAGFSGNAVAVVTPFAQVNEFTALTTERAPRVFIAVEFCERSTDGAGDFHRRERKTVKGKALSGRERVP